MKAINRMSVRFPSKSANEGFARLAVAGFLAPLDPTVEELAELKTIISEAVTNCTVHAYRDTIGPIWITARYDAAGTVQITVRDAGCGIGDTKAVREPLYTTVNDGTRAGMGFTIMESFSDKLRLFSKPGKGTRLEIFKKLTVREE